MPNDEQKHVALPKLYGQPAYARPPRPFTPSERPADPDDMPLEAERTEPEGASAESVAASVQADQAGAGNQRRSGRPVMRRLIGRLLRGTGERRT